MKDWSKLENEKPPLKWWQWILVTAMFIVVITLSLIAHCNFYAPNYKALGLW